MICFRIFSIPLWKAIFWQKYHYSWNLKCMLANGADFLWLQTYVQHLMKIDSKMVYKMIVEEKGHFYVCGDITMAEQVLQTLKSIIQEEGKMTADAVETYFLTVRVCKIFILTPFKILPDCLTKDKCFQVSVSISNKQWTFFYHCRNK